MNWLDSVLEALGVNKVSAVFGFIGAALHAFRSKGNRTERVVSFLTGCAFAAVGPSFLIAWFKLDPNPSYYGGLGFVCGYFGMAIMDAVAEAVSALRGLEWKDVISSWFTKGGGPR